tara:strand:+ start:383 stop:595 length:213 start_codon:yes stop_codon:yes gene_type:complete
MGLVNEGSVFHVRFMTILEVLLKVFDFLFRLLDPMWNIWKVSNHSGFFISNTYGSVPAVVWVQRFLTISS